VLLISGVAIAYWLDFGMTRTQSQASWRFPIAFQAAFAITAFVIVFFLPDTPRWYYVKGRMADGDAVLERLFEAPLEDPRVKYVKDEILASIALENEEKAKFRISLIFWDNSELHVGRRIRIAFMLLFLQQMNGINLVVYYATVILMEIGLSPFLAQIIAAVVNTFFALCCYPLIWTIERFGRRRIMFYGIIGITVTMLIFQTMVSLPPDKITQGTQWTAVTFVILYEGILGYSWVAVPWLYGAEIAPLKYRHVGAAAGAFGEWSGSFITVFGGGIALGNVGPKIWIWSTLGAAVTCVYVWFYCPETGGKSLEEIDIVFADEEVKQSDAARQLERYDIYKEGGANVTHTERTV